MDGSYTATTERLIKPIDDRAFYITDGSTGHQVAFKTTSILVNSKQTETNVFWQEKSVDK